MLRRKLIRKVPDKRPVIIRQTKRTPIRQPSKGRDWNVWLKEILDESQAAAQKREVLS